MSSPGPRAICAWVHDATNVLKVLCTRLLRWSVLAVVLAVAGLVTLPGLASAFSERPMLLPTAGSSVASANAARPTAWLVGAQPGSVATRIARLHAARPVGLRGVYRVPQHRARAFAADLRRRGVLAYAEPDVQLRRAAAFDSAPQEWARSTVVSPHLVAPTPGGVAIGIVDDFVDSTHPDVGAQTQYLNTGPGAVLGPHGTEVASVAAGALNGSGVFGIFPSARLLSYGTAPGAITCSDAAEGVTAAADAGAKVINLSFGSDSDCFTMFAAVQTAYGAGSLVVAAAGNEFEQGNPVIYPAAYPHVLSVAALTRSLSASSFSSENTAVDVAAPGIDVPVATPAAFDSDGSRDGVTQVSGTSYAAPIVAGAAAWLATARPTLSNGQVADVLRRSARDLGPGGWDRSTGYGLVRMSGALLFPTPRHDPLEPNDGIPFVDGTVFARADPYIWRGFGRRRISASADQIEDPIDVYRIRVPSRAALKILVDPNFGDPDLIVFSGRASTTADTDEIIDRSLRGPRRTDVVRLVNNSRRAQTAFVAVEAAGDILDTSYRLSVSRESRR